MHLSDEQIRSFRDRSLPGEDLLLLSSHVAGCEACRARIVPPQELHAQFSRVRSVMRAEAALPFHTTYEEIAAHVDGRLDHSEAELVASHARECPECAAEIEGLRALKQSLGNRHTPADRRRWLDGFWPSSLGWKGGLALAGAAALALAVVVVLGPRRPHETYPQSESGQALARASIRDGKRVFTLSPAGAVSGLESLSPADRAAVEQALAAGSIKAPEIIAQLGRKRELLLGSPDAAPPLELLAPLATVVESQRPVFRWKALAGAQYQVNVYDSQYTSVTASDWMDETHWQGSQPLSRGEAYSWQLKVRREGREFTVPVPPMPEARFQILDAAREEKISALRSEWTDSHLVLGVAYANAGLLDDSARELRELDEQNPGSPTTAALRASVERLRNSNSGPRQSQ